MPELPLIQLDNLSWIFFTISHDLMPKNYSILIQKSTFQGKPTYMIYDYVYDIIFYFHIN